MSETTSFTVCMICVLLFLGGLLGMGYYSMQNDQVLKLKSIESYDLCIQNKQDNCMVILYGTGITKTVR